MKKTLLTAASIAVLFSGCATIIDGKTQKVNFQSQKKQTIVVDGVNYVTPATVDVRRSDNDKAILVKECDQNVVMNTETNPWFFGNIIFGGLLGSTTDYSTEAMWQYEQDIVNVDCK